MKEIHELILPDDVCYAEDHEWAKTIDGTAKIGLGDYAQDQLGDIVFVELPEVGSTFEKGESFGTVESVKAVAELYTPAGGEVIAINEELEAAPDLVNKSPYEDGWMVDLKLNDPGELDALMSKDDYLTMLKGNE